MREIGRRCFFRSSTGFTFGNGEMLVNFQIFGRRCSLNEELIILETGTANNSAYSLRSQFGISSGPHAFEGFSVASSFITLSSDISRSFEAMVVGNLVSGCSKRYSSSGSRKTWLIVFASSWLLKSSSSSMWM